MSRRQAFELLCKAKECDHRTGIRYISEEISKINSERRASDPPSPVHAQVDPRSISGFVYEQVNSNYATVAAVSEAMKRLCPDISDHDLALPQDHILLQPKPKFYIEKLIGRSAIDINSIEKYAKSMRGLHFLFRVDSQFPESINRELLYIDEYHRDLGIRFFIINRGRQIHRGYGVVHGSFFSGQTARDVQDSNSFAIRTITWNKIALIHDQDVDYRIFTGVMQRTTDSDPPLVQCEVILERLFDQPEVNIDFLRSPQYRQFPNPEVKKIGEGWDPVIMMIDTYKRDDRQASLAKALDLKLSRAPTIASLNQNQIKSLDEIIKRRISDRRKAKNSHS